MYRNFRVLSPAGDDGEGGDTEARETPAQINERRNQEQLRRREAISRGVDGRRARDLRDSNGENVVGDFEEGALADSPEARERAAEDEDARAAEALQEAEERAAAAEEEARGETREREEGRARRLQEEGVEEGDDSADPSEQPGDEKVVDGVRYYLTMVGGQPKYLTLKQLRDNASAAANAEQTLQRAQEALQRSATAALSPKDEPAELGEAELESVVLSAVMGDGEAVKRLVSVIRSRPAGTDPQQLSRQVSQQIATTSAIAAAEEATKDLLSNPNLEPVFRQRLRAFAADAPETKIPDAYRQVASQMRKDFAPMLGRSEAPLSKEQRKRTIVNPPSGAGRQPARGEDDREEPVSSQIDQIAKGRGQDRAIRQGRR